MKNYSVSPQVTHFFPISIVKGYRLTTNAVNKTLAVRNFNWKWMSLQHCELNQGLGCYFKVEQQAESKCQHLYQNTLQTFGNQTIDQGLNPVSRNFSLWYDGRNRCAQNCSFTPSNLPWMFTIHSVACCDSKKNVKGPIRLQYLRKYRKSFTEYLFSGGLSEIVKDEVVSQMKQVFGSVQTPQNLITVHIRWGNKNRETTLLTAEKYAQAILKIVEKHEWKDFNIYLATESPQAKAELNKALIKLVPKTQKFKIFLDATVEYNQEHKLRPDHLNLSTRRDYVIDQSIAKDTEGYYGLQVLASVVIGLEANHFVLTTSSNLSRLINEMRQVIDDHCNNCTSVTDLDTGHWRKR